jgi:hypothetical protein
LFVIRHHGQTPRWLNAQQPYNLPKSLTPNFPQLPNLETLQMYKLNSNLTETQFNQVIELSKITGLNFATSLDCLGQSQWVIANALEMFKVHRGGIPSEAFVA